VALWRPKEVQQKLGGFRGTLGCDFNRNNLNSGTGREVVIINSEGFGLKAKWEGDRQLSD